MCLQESSSSSNAAAAALDNLSAWHAVWIKCLRHQCNCQPPSSNYKFCHALAG
jgi:hypothetical protein